jgi:hypothetical protein
MTRVADGVARICLMVFGLAALGCVGTDVAGPGEWPQSEADGDEVADEIEGRVGDDPDGDDPDGDHPDGDDPDGDDPDGDHPDGDHPDGDDPDGDDPDGDDPDGDDPDGEDPDGDEDGDEVDGDGPEPVTPLFADPQVEGRYWQNPADEQVFAYFDDAVVYCERLTWGEFDDWRAPTIYELRRLIRGCPESESGGACDWRACIREGVSSAGCRACSTCSRAAFAGPGVDGCYQHEALEGPCRTYWAGPAGTLEGRKSAHVVAFGNAWLGITYDEGHQPFAVRCVRGQ